MTNHAARRPFSLDPLMAEAKRRARQRRLLVAGALALIVAGVVGVVFASRSPGGPGAVSSTAAGAASGRGRVGLVEAKGPTFPVRTFVLALRHERRLTVGDIEVTENGGSVVDPTLIPASQASIPASQASQDRILRIPAPVQVAFRAGQDDPRSGEGEGCGNRSHCLHQSGTAAASSADKQVDACLFAHRGRADRLVAACRDDFRFRHRDRDRGR
jgi:hypothetical protein